MRVLCPGSTSTPTESHLTEEPTQLLGKVLARPIGRANNEVFSLSCFATEFWPTKSRSGDTEVYWDSVSSELRVCLCLFRQIEH